MSNKNCNQINPCHEWIRYMELFGEPKWTREEAEKQETHYSCNSSSLEAECDNMLLDEQEKQMKEHNLKNRCVNKKL